MAHREPHGKRAQRVAKHIQAALSEVAATTPHTPAAAVVIFKAQLAGACVLDAYALLDAQPGSFGPDKRWHAVLRGCRNHPVHGPQLFDLFA